MSGAGMPWREAREVGDQGERLAGEHLEALGWQVVERNWRCREGELDIVAVDPEGTLVFCEVKTRRSTRFGTPVESVTPEKARRLRRLAWGWLRAHDRHGSGFRIDVIGVLQLPGQETTLQHLRAVA